MIENQDLISRLQKLMSQKRSKKFYAERLGIEIQMVEKLLEQLKDGVNSSEVESEISGYVAILEDTVCKLDEDLKKNQAEITARFKDQVKDLGELIEKCKIDTKVWNIDRYIQNFWGSSSDPHWQVKVWLSKKTEAQNFSADFTKFLRDYKPSIELSLPNIIETPNKVCLVVNNQDQHLNKFDIAGDNDMDSRFSIISSKTKKILEKASSQATLEKIYYIIGSDHFNSEWTNATTKGTAQTNIGTYQDAFTTICNHELNMINMLSSYGASIEILYVSGNHDEYVGWHLITWLKAFFRDSKTISFDTSSRYRKYVRYGKNALMFNHGDAIKPPKLSNVFPVEFRKQWSNCENFYVFTGDKHHEVTIDFNGIMFYQLPALSTAKSSWDDKNGYTCSKPEMVAFVIDKTDGIISIFKERIDNEHFKRSGQPGQRT